MKRLKEKGKLKKPSSSSHRNGSNPSLSTPSAMAASTPTTVTSMLLETPRTAADEEELNDIFGADDEDMMDVDVDAELDGADLTPLGQRARSRGFQDRPNGGNGAEFETSKTSPVLMPVDRWSAGSSGKPLVQVNGAQHGGLGDQDTPLRTPRST